MAQVLSTTFQTELSANIVLFCRFLRSKGFSLAALDEAEALRAISFLPVHSESYFKDALRAVLTKNKFQQIHFDTYYQAFKEEQKKGPNAKIKSIPDEKEQFPKKRKDAQFEALKDWLNLNPSKEKKEVASFSDIEVLTKKNFHDLSEDEMRLMLRMLQKMARKLAHQKSRLQKVSRRHRHLSLKRTIRANLRKGGEIQQLVFSEKKERKLKLVLLCDVSRSMDLYSRFFIHLIYAFQNAYDKIETFVFSTALHQVSELLNTNEFDKAFALISERVPHWSGGTTIGSCLHEFTNDYGHGMLDKKTIVLILSDGWDTGKPEVMKAAMKGMYKKTKKVIWLNPLAGSPDFSPEAIGMKTALPYIDVLASAHNFESLKQLLQQLGKKRNLGKLPNR